MAGSAGRTNGNSPANDGASTSERQARELMRWVAGQIRRFSEISPIKVAPNLTSLLIIAFVGGGAVGFGVNNSLLPGSITEPHIGIIHHVLVDSTYTKQPPGSANSWYMVGFHFVQPQPCDAHCRATLADLLGSGYSCPNGICSGEFKDIDEGDKTNSSDIFHICQQDQGRTITQTIVYTGRRNSASSEYANIILVEPDSVSLDPPVK